MQATRSLENRAWIETESIEVYHGGDESAFLNGRLS